MTDTLEFVRQLREGLPEQPEPRFRRIEIAGIKIIAEKHMPENTAFLSDQAMVKLIDLLDGMGAEVTAPAEPEPDQEENDNRRPFNPYAAQPLRWQPTLNIRLS
ncbi:hypothetical protein [Endozoicomonas lisbonensis]|uniref:Uncharacterized protein n=1 Tax=Endozoicomonas lisbonensis TaxID=3120522 RepID=A0ABV2SPC8_9GAMM